ncbi:MAG: hypothetical protein LBB47_07800 [Spirochaetaceae bacterium]|nr:hypothetical protein [Spirochaetaceae bacterium]
MKNIVYTGMFFMLTLAACTSMPIDRGIYNPQDVSEEDLSILYIHEYINVQQIDNTKVDWNRQIRKPQIVKIPSGVHSFSVRYHDGRRFTFSMTTIGQFEKGNTYLLKGVINGRKVDLHILLYNNKVEGEEVTLDMNKLRGNDPNVISRYIKYVLNPTMDEVGNSVRLENEKYILTYKPDMVYSLTDKETEIISEGRRGFSTDFRMTNGKTFLLETDISNMSRQQFLSSKYDENAQIILIPIDCNEREVIYKYEKPTELQGSEIKFTITEIEM